MPLVRAFVAGGVLTSAQLLALREAISAAVAKAMSTDYVEVHPGNVTVHIIVFDNVASSANDVVWMEVLAYPTPARMETIRTRMEQIEADVARSLPEDCMDEGNMPQAGANFVPVPRDHWSKV